MTLHGARGQYETAQSVVPTGQTEQQNRLPGNQPEFMNPHQPLDLEAVREAARRCNNQWIAQMHNVWRSEVAQQQLQQDEEVEWRLAVADHSSLINRMNRTEEMVNHTSGHQLANYQMQLGADHLPPPHPPHPPLPPIPPL